MEFSDCLANVRWRLCAMSKINHVPQFLNIPAANLGYIFFGECFGQSVTGAASPEDRTIKLGALACEQR